MMDLLDEFLGWGPYGLYATVAMMLCAIPLGWMYAYIACVGKRRDITEPDPERQKAAWGGAIIIALLVFVWRQMLVPYDTAAFMRWMYTGYMPFMGSLFRPLLDYADSLVLHGTNIFIKLLGYAEILVLAPASMAVALFGSMALIIVVMVGAVAMVIFGFTFIGGALGTALWYLPGFLLGLPIVLYFLFVRLPLQVVYRRAIREGRWPTTDELVLALRKGTLDKAEWQSKIMAYKSRRFETSLNEQVAKIGN